MAKNEWEVVSQTPEQKNADDEWGVASQAPAQTQGGDDWGVVSEEPTWVQNYVPRKTEGPTRTVEGKTYPKPVKKANPPPESGVMGGEDVWAPVVEQQKFHSVMENRQVPVLPTEDRAVVDPQFVAAVQAQINAMPANERQATLDAMVKRQDVYGRAARAIAGRYAAMDQNQTPTARKFDPRLEAQTERFAEDNRYDPESLARAQAMSGRLVANPAELKAAPEEYIAKPQEVKPPTYGETIGANFAGGFADALVSAAAALTDYTGASDTASQLDATRKSIKEFQAQYGGNTRLGRVSSMTGALTPALVEVLAAPYTGGSSLIPLMTTGVLFALPGFRDTYKEQIKSGAPQSVAIEHALASAGMMMVGGRLIATGGKALPEALQASERLLPQLTSAAAEGVVFNAADSATHKFIDTLNGRDTNAPWFDPESALENALAFSAMRGIHKGIEHVQGRKAANELVPYADENNYDKLIELAKSKGFFTPEQRQRQTQEQELPPDLIGNLRPSEEMKDEWEVESHVPTPTPTPAPAPASTSREERVAKLAEEIQKRTNIPIENATRIAETRIPKEEQVNAPAETKAEGAENVGQAITEPSGERPDLVEQPDTNVPATGAGVSDGSRVVSARQDVAGAVEPKGTQPAPIAPPQGKTLIEELKDLHAQGKATDEDLAKVTSWAKANDEPREFGKKLFELIHEIESRPSEEQKAAEVKPTEEVHAPVEKAKVEEPTTPTEEDRRRAEQDAKVAEAQAIAKTNFDTALDQVNDPEYGGDIDAALDAYRQNTADTLNEQGKNDSILYADREFDRLVKEHKEEQEQPVLAAETPAEAKRRGRKPLERPAEQQQKIELSRKEQKKLTDNADYAVKKLKAALDEVLKPVDENLEASKVDEAIEDKAADKKHIVTRLVELDLNPNLRNTAVGKRVKELLNDRSKISQREIDTAKSGIEFRRKTDLRGEIGESFQGESALGRNTYTDPLPSRSSPSKGKVNAAFNKSTNAAQALTVIAKTGNPFQSFLAKRLRGFVNGVKFVVLEKGDAVPAELQKHADLWETADGLYAPDSRTVYVRGESFGDAQGVNNITVLHEILHAATNQRISLGLLPGVKATNPKLARFVSDLIELGLHAGKQYDLRKSIGWVPKDLQARVESTKREDGTYGIFEEPQEFLAYGMSDEAFQEFLGSIKSLKPQETGFTAFVRNLYNEWAKAFGRDADGLNAMSDLINVTDKILTAEKTSAMRLVEKGMPPLPSKQTGEKETPLERTEAQQREAVSRALNAVALSRAGEELGKSVSVAAALRDPRLVWRELKLAWGSMNDAKRSFFSHFMDLEAIAKGPGEHIKSLQDLYEAVQKKNGMTEVILRGAANQSEAIVRFYRAHPKFKSLFEDLVNASTHAEYDPANPNNKHRDLALDLMYNSLPERGQEVYRNLRDYNADMKAFGDQIIADQIEKLELPADEREKIMAGLRQIYESERSVEPYFPLMRYGDYVLEIGKGDNRTSIRYETKTERDRAALEYAKKRNANLKDLRTSKEVVISDDIGSSKMRATIEGTSELLKEAYKAVDSAKLTEPGAKEAIKDNLYQAYLASMPEASVRKMFMHRKGTPGFSSDVLRNVNNMGVKMSRQFAKLRYAPDMRNALSAANKVIETDPTYKAVVARANELIAESLQPPERTSLAKFWDTASGIMVKISYLRYMTSWSSAIMQPLDIFLKGVPTLLGNHGPKGPAELTKMLKVWNQFGIVEHQADGTTRWRMPSIEHAKGLTPTERRAVREMAAWGVHKDTLASTVFNQARKPTTNKIWQTTKDVVGNLILGNLMHHGERLSREVVYLTSFRLNFEKSKNFDDAVRKAVAETYEVYGDYSPDNRPLAMRGATGKLVTMYKFFPLVTYKNLIGNFFKILSTTNSPKEKVQAATKFFGVMGTHLLLGGIEALPMFSVVMSILGAAWNQWGRDPDAPDDMKNISYETWWKTKFMPQQFGDWSELLKKGAVNHFTGWDISSRISLNDMWFRAPTMPATTNKELMGNWALALAGPVPSLALSTTQGLQEIANGQYERGLEKIMPGSISNLMIAHRYATEGIQTPQGVQLAQPGTVPTSEIVGQTIGYRPAALAAAQEVAFKSKVAEKVVTAEKNSLTTQYKDNFLKSTDPTMPVEFQQRFNEKWGDTLDKVIDFNIRHPKNQIDIEKLNESLSERVKEIVETEIGGGVRITPENVDLVGDAANEAEKILSKYKKNSEKDEWGVVSQEPASK